jgi:selenium metabolism protein YedF
MKTLDMRGNPCPIPVVNAKKALDEQGADGVVVIVDNFVAVQNLEKMAQGSGRRFSYVEDGSSRQPDAPLYNVTIANSNAHLNAHSNGGVAGVSPAEGGSVSPQGWSEGGGFPPPETAKKGPVVLITADSMGRGAEELGKLLIKGFVFSLTQLNPLPEAVIFLNGGARLTTAGANTVSDLKTLQENGTGIYTCGTCANYYKLTEALAVGSIVDMMKITNTLAKASCVITI